MADETRREYQRAVWVTTDADGTPVGCGLDEAEERHEASGIPGALVVPYIPAESAPPPAASPLGQSTCAGSYPGTIRDLVHRLEVCVAEEQERPLPRNHFIAVFCDVIRYMRDEGAKPFATVEPPAESLNAWAVRCLDLWAAHQEDSAMVMVLSRTGPDWCYGVHGRDRKPLGYLGETPDAARISAARALCADQPDLFPREPGT